LKYNSEGSESLGKGDESFSGRIGPVQWMALSHSNLISLTVNTRSQLGHQSGPSPGVTTS
jgi:hypothetical protein